MFILKNSSFISSILTIFKSISLTVPMHSITRNIWDVNQVFTLDSRGGNGFGLVRVRAELSTVEMNSNQVENVQADKGKELAYSAEFIS